MRSRLSTRNRALAAIVAVLPATALLTSVTAAPAAAKPQADDRGVIVNMFQWNWDSVAAECAEVLGPQGFGGVQVSPPQESISLPGADHPWWEVYQPVSYQLTSRLGDRADFAAMVRSCDAAGVDVYVDAVLNHMTGQNNGGTGYGGSTFTDKHVYPGLYSGNDFHYHPQHCPNPSGEIADYDNLAEVQNCELLGLADLRTDFYYVRDTLVAYLNDLVGLGVDGFRVDAAKHIPADDLRAIADRVDADVYQEVIPGGAVRLDPYRASGDLLEFTFARKLKEQFHGNIAHLETIGESWGMQPDEYAVTFVDNHDTERDGSTLSYRDGPTYRLATVFTLAWDYGSPQVYTGFRFSGRDESPPANADGTVRPVDCGSGEWTCTHRDPAVRGMVGWRSAVAGAPVRNWWTNGDNAIAFSRGDAGFVAINNTSAPLTREFTTGLPQGTYCDVLAASDGQCVQVSGSGRATITVQPKDAVAIHVATE
ncbi:alpha-amylase [Amycolatopsis marina]|uniref:Alpha-amylase n=1 Tax=Amycolatopsis marina TaxID=490629 RepID=A0A1I0VRK3_9PSEU|nr:alpha-amylase family protein [Amycolatopsis marina]SFA78868.1 alpha-amylase [Amycolatopsis marina]